MKRTIRCSYNGSCDRCPENRCLFPIYCYALPLELALNWLSGAETNDPQLGVAFRRAHSALEHGALEDAEDAIESALELFAEIQNSVFTNNRRRGVLRD